MPTNSQVIGKGICIICRIENNINTMKFGVLGSEGGVCQECISQEKYVKRCTSCNILSLKDCMHYHEKQWLCTNCFEARYFICAQCEDTYSQADGMVSPGGEQYCIECYQDRYTNCDRCNVTVRRRDIRHSNRTEKSYCPNCFEKVEQDKGELLSTSFELTEGIERFFGIELEMCKPGGVNSVHSRYWDYKEDSSIEPNQRDDDDDDDDDEGNYGEEHITCVMQGDKGLKEIEYHVRRLNKAYYYVNDSCGFHVHIDARDLNMAQLQNIARFVYKYEACIYSLIPANRRDGDNSYCKPLPYNTAHLTSSNFRQVIRDMDRYHGLNFASYFEHASIEFRYHSGTINFRKIHHWIKLCLSIVERFKDVSVSLNNKARGLAGVEEMLTLLRLNEDSKAYFRERYASLNNAQLTPIVED